MTNTCWILGLLLMGAPAIADVPDDAEVRQVVRAGQADVAVCARRHARRTGRPPARSVLRFTVQPDGRTRRPTVVGAASTVFGRCVATRVGRWRFAPFAGAAIEVERTLVYQ